MIATTKKTLPIHEYLAMKLGEQGVNFLAYKIWLAEYLGAPKLVAEMKDWRDTPYTLAIELLNWPNTNAAFAKMRLKLKDIETGADIHGLTDYFTDHHHITAKEAAEALANLDYIKAADAAKVKEWGDLDPYIRAVLNGTMRSEFLVVFRQFKKQKAIETC